LPYESTGSLSEERIEQLWSELIEQRFGGGNRSAVASAAGATAAPLTVPELASRLCVTASKAYRLLEGGAVPGAFKTFPHLAKSRWYIPADAPEQFLARGRA